MVISGKNHLRLKRCSKNKEERQSRGKEQEEKGKRGSDGGVEIKGRGDRNK